VILIFAQPASSCLERGFRSTIPLVASIRVVISSSLEIAGAIQILSLFALFLSVTVLFWTLGGD
jgi:predicted exporter